MNWGRKEPWFTKCNTDIRACVCCNDVHTHCYFVVQTMKLDLTDTLKSSDQNESPSPSSICISAHIILSTTCNAMSCNVRSVIVLTYRALLQYSIDDTFTRCTHEAQSWIAFSHFFIQMWLPDHFQINDQDVLFADILQTNKCKNIKGV